MLEEAFFWVKILPRLAGILDWFVIVLAFSGGAIYSSVVFDLKLKRGKEDHQGYYLWCYLAFIGRGNQVD